MAMPAGKGLTVLGKVQGKCREKEVMEGTGETEPCPADMRTKSAEFLRVAEREVAFPLRELQQKAVSQS